MNLIVTDSERDTSFNEVVISVAEFCDIANQPYIATAGFDTLIIDLDKRIPAGYLKAIVGKMKIIPRIVGEINVDVIRLLSEIYREKKSNIRFAYMKNDGSVKDIIKELSSQFNWDSYY